MNNQGANLTEEEQEIYALEQAMEQHAEEQFEGDIGEEITAAPHTSGVPVGAGESDRTPPAHGGPPPPPPPGRPIHHQEGRAPIRTTSTILGRDPTMPSVGARMGMNPTFSPRPSYPHIPARDDSRPYKSALQS